MQSENFSQEAVQAVQRNFYVDDFLLSSETPEEGARIAEEVSRMLSAAGFTLTKWVSNESTSLKNIPESKLLKYSKTINCTSEEQERVLGIKWNVENDQFAVDVSIPNKPYTRRGLLSMLSSIFDPLGFVAPILVSPKLWLRELKDHDWDDEVSDAMKAQWQS